MVQDKGKGRDGGCETGRTRARTEWAMDDAGERVAVRHG
jgi:hypothetical protein